MQLIPGSKHTSIYNSNSYKYQQLQLQLCLYLYLQTFTVCWFTTVDMTSWVSHLVSQWSRNTFLKPWWVMLCWTIKYFLLSWKYSQIMIFLVGKTFFRKKVFCAQMTSAINCLIWIFTPKIISILFLSLILSFVEGVNYKLCVNSDLNE